MANLYGVAASSEAQVRKFQLSKLTNIVRKIQSLAVVELRASDPC